MKKKIEKTKKEKITVTLVENKVIKNTTTTYFSLIHDYYYL